MSDDVRKISVKVGFVKVGDLVLRTRGVIHLPERVISIERVDRINGDFAATLLTLKGTGKYIHEQSEDRWVALPEDDIWLVLK